MSLRRVAAVLTRRAANAANAATPATTTRAATTHAKLAGKVESSGKADIFGLYAGLAISAGFVAYDQMYPEEVRSCLLVVFARRRRPPSSWRGRRATCMGELGLPRPADLGESASSTRPPSRRWSAPAFANTRTKTKLTLRRPPPVDPPF
jgi:hypothetical protein